MASTIYNDTVVDHFEHPRNPWLECEGLSFGAQHGENTRLNNRSCGQGGSVATGVWIAFELEMERNVVVKARFRAYGCPHTVALASWLTERMVGERVDSSYTFDQQEIRSILDLPTEKLRSVLVAEDAIRACARQTECKEAC